MRKMNSLLVLAIALLGTTLMSAQATRTWVSGVGDDANPCSRTAPCKTFAGAISKTSPGGEIDALDPGGFGALTITKSITLDGGGGQVASVLVAGTNGIVVAAGATDVVIIRNLRLDGLRGGGNANAGLNGIRFISGAAMIVENCVIFGFNQNGVDIALGSTGGAEITNTNIENVGGDGIKATTTSGTVLVAVKQTSVLGAGSNGIEANNNSRVVISNSVTQAALSNGVLATGNAEATIDHGDITFNANGIQAGTAGAATFVADSKIAYNGTAFASAGGGTNCSYGTNRIHSNGSDGPFSACSPGER